MYAASASRLLGILGFALALAGCAETRLPEASGDIVPSAYMATGQEVAPPIGFIGFCLRNEKDCEGGTDTPSNIALTPARWNELNSVNDYVNRLPEVTDEQRYGVPEYWTYADAQGGDCEDLVLEKRKLLIEHGWPADALLIATVTEWNDEGHSVLLVETDKGEYVLDNKNWEIVSWKDTPYTWQARQSRERPYIWVDLNQKTFHQIATTLPPLGAPIPFIEAVKTASAAKQLRTGAID